MILTTYNGSPLWLVLAPPNWANSTPKLSPMLPFTNIQKALSGRQSRRALGLSLKYSLVYTPIFLNAFLANQFRSALNTIKTERIGVPLWTDICTTATALTSTGTSVTLNQTPARSGRAFVLIAADGFDFEIVIVTGSFGDTLTLAARTGFAWPIGTQIFPLLFGKFAARPQLESITPAIADGELSLIENSPLTEQITPAVTSSLATVGPGITGTPDFSGYRLWDIEPAWSQMLDDSESDIAYKAVGFGREDQEYAIANWNRRGMTMSFDARGRDAIARLETLFADRVGPVKAFFIPTFRNDLELAADVASGDTTFTIKDSAYELPEYDEVPGSGFVAFVENGYVDCQRVTSVDGTTVHVENPFTLAHSAGTTRISFLLLCCLVDAKIDWQSVTPSRAQTSLKFIEVADEYVTPNSAVYTHSFLYQFTESLPNGTTNTWYYTSFENNVTYGGNTYTPAPLSHGAPKKTLNLGDSVTLTSWGGNFAADSPLNRFLPYTLNAELGIVITKCNPDGTSARTLWSGVVKQLSTKGTDWTADCGLSRKFDSKIPRFVFKSTDNFIQYSAPTQLSASAFKVTGTIASISGMTVTVSGVSNANDWFSIGYLDTGATGHAEARSILKSTVSGSVQTLTIDRPFLYAVVGQSIDLYAGYDATREQCDTKFNNNGVFGGHPYRPPTNPTIKTHDIVTPTGGKK